MASSGRVSTAAGGGAAASTAPPVLSARSASAAPTPVPAPAAVPPPFLHGAGLEDAQLHNSMQVVEMVKEDQRSAGRDEERGEGDSSSEDENSPAASPPFSLHNLSLPHPPPAPATVPHPPRSASKRKRSTLLNQLYPQTKFQSVEDEDDGERLTVAELRRQASTEAYLASLPAAPAGRAAQPPSFHQESKESPFTPGVSVSPLRPSSARPSLQNYPLPRSRAGSVTSTASLTARSRPLSPAASPRLRPRSGGVPSASEHTQPVPPRARRPSTASSTAVRESGGRGAHHSQSASISSASGHSAHSSIALHPTSAEVIARSTVYDTSATMQSLLDARSLASPSTSVRAMEYDLHLNRVEAVRSREERLATEWDLGHAAIGNREAQLETLRKLQEEADEVDAHFEARAVQRDRRQANAVLQKVMSRDDTAASTVLKGVQGWLEIRAMDGAVDEPHLLQRMEKQGEETEHVRSDAEKAINSLIHQLHIPPPLRLELMSKLRASTHQSAVDREQLIETLKRNLWKARYYLKDAVHGFTGEIHALEQRLEEAHIERKRLALFEAEVNELLFQKAEVADQLATEKYAHSETRQELGSLKAERYTQDSQLSRLEKNDEVLRDQKTKSAEQIKHLTAQLTESLRVANSLTFQMRSLQDAHRSVTRGWRVKEAQLDAVNEMFRARKEYLERIKSERARREAMEKRRKEACERKAAAAAAGADAADGTFLTGVPGQAGEVDPADVESAQDRRTRLLRPVHYLLSHLSTNKKLYRLLQLHPENAVQRPEMMGELRVWILEAERQLEQAMKRVKEAEAAEEEEEDAAAGQRSADIDWIRLVESQQRNFRFLHDSTLYSDETPEQREDRERRQEEENDELLRILEEEAQRRTSEDDTDEDEAAVVRRAKIEYDSDSELALASIHSTHPQLTSEERAARLRRALDRSTMTPQAAREDRRRERREWKERREQRRQEEMQRQAVLAQERIDAEAKEQAAQAEADRVVEAARQSREDAMVEILLAEQAKPSYMSSTGRLRRAKTLTLETTTDLSARPQVKRQSSRGLASPPMSPKIAPAHDRAALLKELRDSGLLDQPLAVTKSPPVSPRLRPASGNSPQSPNRPAVGRPPSLLKMKSVGSRPSGGSLPTSPRASSTRAASSSRSKKAKKKPPVANFVFGDDESVEMEDDEEEESKKTAAASDPPPSEALHLDLAHLSPDKVQSFHESIVAGSEILPDPTADNVLHLEHHGPSAHAATAFTSKRPKSASKKTTRIDTHDRARAQESSPNGSKPASFLPGAYRGLAKPAASAYAGAVISSWPGDDFFRAPTSAQDSAARKAEFESLVLSAARLQMDVWVSQQKKKDGERKRNVYVQCPDIVVTREELSMLEHFFDVPSIEGGQQPPAGQQLLLKDGTASTSALAASSPVASSHGSHRTIGCQVGIPPAYSNVHFYRWYLDCILADLKLGRRRAVEVEPPWSLYAWLGHDKVETMESATLSTMSALLPFTLPSLSDLSSRVSARASSQSKQQRRARREQRRKEAGLVFAEGIGEEEEEKEDEREAQEEAKALAMEEDAQRVRSTDTDDLARAPFHPLGVRGTDRVLYSTGSKKHLGGSHLKPSSSLSTVRSRRTPSGHAALDSSEARTEAGLEEFIAGLDALPEPGEEESQVGAGRLWGDQRPAAAANAGADPASRPAPITASEILEAARIHDQHRRRDLDAIVQLVAQLDRKRVEKERVKTKRREMQEYLEGKREHPPADYDVTTHPVAAVASIPSASVADQNGVIPLDPSSRPYSLYSNYSNIPPSQRSHTSSSGRARLAEEFYSSAVLPEVWNYSSGAGRAADARAIIPHADPHAQSSTAAGSSSIFLPPSTLLSSLSSLQPYPFDRVPLHMKPGKVELPRDLDVAGEFARVNDGIGADKAISPQSPSVPISKSWLSHARAQLYSAQDSLLLRRKALLRAMLGPAREALVKELGGKVVGEEEQGRKGVDARFRSGKAAANPAASFATHPKSAVEQAATKAFGKLELYARMRQDRAAADSAATEKPKKTTTSLPAVASAKPPSSSDERPPPLASQFSLLSRLRHQDAELRAAAVQLEAMQEMEESRDRVAPLAAATTSLAPSSAPVPAAASAGGSSTSDTSGPLIADVLISDWKRRESEQAAESLLQAAHDQRQTKGGATIFLPKPPSIASTAPRAASESANIPPRPVRPQTVGQQLKRA